MDLDSIVALALAAEHLDGPNLSEVAETISPRFQGFVHTAIPHIRSNGALVMIFSIGLSDHAKVSRYLTTLVMYIKIPSLMIVHWSLRSA